MKNILFLDLYIGHIRNVCVRRNYNIILLFLFLNQKKYKKSIGHIRFVCVRWHFCDFWFFTKLKTDLTGKIIYWMKYHRTHTFRMCPMAFLWIFLLKNQKLNKLLQNQIIKKIASDTYETYVSDAYYSWKIYIQHIWWQYIHLYFFQYKETAMICSILNMWENVVGHIRNVCVRRQKKSILLQNH
jgi:hypothetical protein